MNERIKKIVEETYVDVITTRGMTVVEDGCYIVSPDRLEQYTHAVVRECLDKVLGLIVEETFEKDIGPYEHWNRALGTVALEIEQHFWGDAHEQKD